MGFWTNWIGRTFGLREHDSPLYYGGDNASGEVVTTHGAMQLSAFWACVRLYSQIIATLPIGVYQKLPNGDRQPLSDHPLYRLLSDSPNADQTAVEFWEGRVLGLCTTGNGFAEKVFTGKRLVSLEHMPADTWVRRTESGALEYRYAYLGKEVKLPQERVFHIRAFGGGEDYGNNGASCGLSPVSHARQTLGLAMATDRAAAQTFSRGMRAKGFFTSPTTLTQPQRDQAQKVLIDPFTGPNAKQWGILEGGFDFKLVNITPRDAELILSRKFNVEDICRWFGVPPVLIGHAAEGQTMWGSGIEQIMLGFYKMGLVPYLERIEQRIHKDLLTPEDRAQGIYVEFNVEGLLRGDSAARGELYSKLVNVAGITPAEIRRKENFATKDGSDVLLVNSTLVPLSQAGQKQAQPAPPPGGQA